ncbi:sensor histidine kinase [Magnetococcus sp. PR-3]|uniref:sensor histidine kinase n=1 Tax=Magnetococcus sp. PR-3 TaxID=3120355 RepID=UPI002FCE020B
MSDKKRRSLLAQSLLRVFPIALILMALVWFTIILLGEQMLRDEHATWLDQHTARIRQAVQIRLQEMTATLEGLAANPLLVSGVIMGEQEREVLHLFFQSLRAGRMVGRFIITDFQGQVLARQQGTRLELRGAPWLEGMMIDQGKNHLEIGTHGLLLAVPVRYNGLPEGVLALHIPLENLAELLPAEPKLRLAIHDAGGKVILSNSVDALTHVDELMQAAWMWNRVGLINPVHRFLFVGVMEEDIPRSLWLLKIGLIIAFILDMVVLTIGIVLVVRSVRKPLRQLSEVLRQVEYAGDTTLELKGNPPHEVYALQASFEALNANLSEARSRIEWDALSMARQERLATLGALTAGVAHEVNNPLGVAIMATSELKTHRQNLLKIMDEEGLSEEEFQEFMEQSGQLTDLSMHNLQRAAELIRSFKRVAVDQTSVTERIFNMREQLQAVIASHGYAFKRQNIEVVLHCIDDLEFQGAPGLFSQIYTNFITNSLAYAFSPQGPGRIELEVAVTETQVALSYRDNGKGMSAQQVKQIYEPFFTTGREQGGSGLGMHIVHTIVTQDLQGQIQCHSLPGHGVNFEIRIPADLLRPKQG